MWLLPVSFLSFCKSTWRSTSNQVPHNNPYYSNMPAVSTHIFIYCQVTDDVTLLLTAIGQIMLYVDGMNGVINHSDTIQWLYSLTASRVSIYTAMQPWYLIVTPKEFDFQKVNSSLLLTGDQIIVIIVKNISFRWLFVGSQLTIELANMFFFSVFGEIVNHLLANRQVYWIILQSIYLLADCQLPVGNL